MSYDRLNFKNSALIALFFAARAMVILFAFSEISACAGVNPPKTASSKGAAVKMQNPSDAVYSSGAGQRRGEAMLKYQDVRRYIKEVSIKHKLDINVLNRAFQNSYFDYRIIELMDMPAERKHWTEYSKGLLSKERISNGKKYIKDHDKALKTAFNRWGVQPQIVAAIIGIESSYGKFEFRRTAVASLATIAFEYPRRSAYFKDELTKLFILAKRDKRDPLSYKSSYAGAIGIAQFMPYNILRYGRDGNGDRRIDLNTHGDAIESVAYYLKEHGWRKSKNTAAIVALKRPLPNSMYGESPCDVKKRRSVKALKSNGVIFNGKYPNDEGGIVVKIQKDEYNFMPVVFFENACPIYRYNNSVKYAAAAAFLAKELTVTAKTNSAKNNGSTKSTKAKKNVKKKK